MAVEDTEGQAPEPTEKRGGMAKTAMMGLGIFVLVLAAQIVAPPINQMLYGGAEEETEELLEGEGELLGEGSMDFAELDPAIYTPLDPPLVVSLVDPGGSSRFLQLSVQAMSRSQDVIDEVRAHAPALRNSFLFLISNRTFDDLSSLEGKEQLRADMLVQAQQIMAENTGQPGIEELYFTSFVIQ